MAKVRVHNAYINNEEFKEMVEVFFEGFKKEADMDEQMATAEAWADKLTERYAEKFNDKLSRDLAAEIVSEAQEAAEERYFGERID